MDNTNSAALPMEPKRSGLVSRMFANLASRRPAPGQLVALDIGTSRIMVIVAHYDEDYSLEVLGCGSTASHGLKAGMVVNIEETVDSIRRAVEEAEEMTDCTIRNVNVGIAGSHIHSINASGAIPVREGEITPPVVERVLDAASAVKLTDDKRILHVLPQEYAIDDQYGIRTPLGMSGVRLDARVHLVTAGAGALHNLVKCVRHCGLTVDHVVLEQLAASEAALTPDERDLGVCLVDIGGGTSDIAVFYAGAIHYTATIPVAGDHVNRDIAVALSTRVQDAEHLKIEHGCAVSDSEQDDQVLEVPGLGGRPAAQLRGSVLGDIIRPRYMELFESDQRRIAPLRLLRQDRGRRAGADRRRRDGARPGHAGRGGVQPPGPRRWPAAPAVPRRTVQPAGVRHRHRPADLPRPGAPGRGHLGGGRLVAATHSFMDLTFTTTWRTGK